MIELKDIPEVRAIIGSKTAPDILYARFPEGVRIYIDELMEAIGDLRNRPFNGRAFIVINSKLTESLKLNIGIDQLGTEDPNFEDICRSAITEAGKMSFPSRTIRDLTVYNACPGEQWRPIDDIMRELGIYQPAKKLTLLQRVMSKFS